MLRDKITLLAVFLSLIAICVSAASLRASETTAKLGEGTRIEADSAANVIRIIVDGAELATVNAEGLTVSSNITYTGTLTDISDGRFKTGIEPLATRLDDIEALRPVRYTMRGDVSGRQEFGLIAQDVAAIYPQLVETRADGAMAVNYVGVIAPLIDAVKILRAENEGLRRRIGALEQAAFGQSVAGGAQ